MKSPITYLFIAGLALTGCQNISKQDLQALQSKAASFEEESQQLQAENAQLKQNVDDLKQQLSEEIAAKQVLVEQSAKGDIKVTMQQDILFSSSSYEIDQADAAAILDKVVQSIQQNASASKLIIIGHSDSLPVAKKWRSRFSDNWDLSARRAGEVARYLIWGANFPKENIAIVGRADVEPVASNDTEEGRAKNRRIEILIQK